MKSDAFGVENGCRGEPKGGEDKAAAVGAGGCVLGAAVLDLI